MKSGRGLWDLRPSGDARRHRADMGRPSPPASRLPRRAARSQPRRPPPPWQRVPWPLAPRARADPESRAPALSRPRAACQPRLEGSALYGPRAGRKRLVGPGEEAPYMARGGRGLAGGGELARDGGRFRRRGPKPQRATPTRARACGLRPRRRPATPDPSAGPLFADPAGMGGYRAAWTSYQTELVPSSVTLGKKPTSLSLRFLLRGLWG